MYTVPRISHPNNEGSYKNQLKQGCNENPIRNDLNTSEIAIFPENAYDFNCFLLTRSSVLHITEK